MNKLWKLLRCLIPACFVGSLNFKQLLLQEADMNKNCPFLPQGEMQQRWTRTVSNCTLAASS
jgi:hypothetical protein